jgi:hypothetical protein
VPFGDIKPADPKYNRFAASIHNYFFLKAIDQVRPGGFVAFIALALILIAISSEPTLEEADEGSLLGWFRTQVGKILLWLNMKEGGVYFNYPFQKGFVEKLFENLPIPQI